MKIEYESDEACNMAAQIAEEMYYYSLDESCDLVDKYGKFASYEESKYPKLHFDLFDKYYGLKRPLTKDWNGLRAKIAKKGLANARFLAFMPTASASI